MTSTTSPFIFFSVIFVAAVLILIVFHLKNKEYFEEKEETPYLKYVYEPDALELNNLKIQAPKRFHSIAKKIFQKYPKKISDNFDETPDIIVGSRFRDHSKTHNFLSKVKELHFFFLTLNKQLNSTSDIKINDKFQVISDNEKKILQDLFPNNEIVVVSQNNVLTNSNDIFFFIDHEISKTLQKIISTRQNRIKMLKMNKEDTFVDISNFNFSNINKKIQTRKIDLEIYIRKNLDNDIVERITQSVFEPNGILRSYALSSNKNDDFHEITNEWLKSKGLIHVTRENEPIDFACALLAGKSPCAGDALKYAQKVYRDEFEWRFEKDDDPFKYF